MLRWGDKGLFSDLFFLKKCSVASACLALIDDIGARQAVGKAVAGLRSDRALALLANLSAYAIMRLRSLTRMNVLKVVVKTEGPQQTGETTAESRPMELWIDTQLASNGYKCFRFRVARVARALPTRHECAKHGGKKNTCCL